MKKTYRDEIWDFRKANTKKYTHCFHQYPAMMIPQVAGKILDEFGKNAKLLFDPYCGTGTSLVEANIRGIDAVGTDINPLARLIAKAKTTIISLKTLDLYLKDFNDFAFNINLGVIEVNPVIPDFRNIDYWFKRETQITLAIIKKYIEDIDNINIQNFFKVAFSETIREVSLTRNSEFKLYRITKEQIVKFNPDVFSIMISKLFRNRNGMEEYIHLKNKNNIKSMVYDFNTVFEIPEKILSPGSVDIIMTSPPYGDSRTTVAYGQFSRLSNQWLDIENANEIDKKSMGGKRLKDYIDFCFKPLDKVLKEISKKDEKRVYDVISFYIDYRQSIHNISKLVRKNGIVAFVVGNRRVKGFEIPNDEITKEFFEKNGFKHIKTIIRKIPNKRMPKRNSPSNVVGITETTMNYEYILILKKENLQ
jgi:tRNA G10  N-methylase Trm11